MNSLKRASYEQRRHSSADLERLICNSSLTSCASFHCLAQRCQHYVFGDSAFAPFYAELRSFAEESCPTVDTTMKKTRTCYKPRIATPWSLFAVHDWS